MVGGLLPDADVLIRSRTDPLLFLEYHRQFTHSLVMIPVGALLTALLLWPLMRRHLTWPRVYGFAAAGYGTHALLDACTSYGTQLFWPFSDLRVAWNMVSVVDPLFTVPLFALAIAAAWTRRRHLANVGLVIAALYLLLGQVQYQRALTASEGIARARGHEVRRRSVKPSFANLLLWKSIYESEGRYYVDALRLGFNSTYYPGASAKKLLRSRDLPWLESSSQQADDLEQFSHYSSGYLALDERHPNSVGDVRFSVLPNELAPLWGIEFDPTAQQQEHVRFFNRRGNARRRLGEFWAMLKGVEDKAIPDGTVNSAP
jgi:inner membrane protein